jgi:flavin-dependent dehydrogenase
MNEELAKNMKETCTSSEEFYNQALKLAPDLKKLLGTGKLVSDLKFASDYSYHSSSYAIPYARIVGDAGCFIDPFFSSGVHVALTGALSAAITISAAIRHDCSEEVAARWHSNKIREAYARFLFVVLGAYKQMRNQKEYILSDFGENNFDRAFKFFGPGAFLPISNPIILYLEKC